MAAAKHVGSLLGAGTASQRCLKWCESHVNQKKKKDWLLFLLLIKLSVSQMEARHKDVLVLLLLPPRRRRLSSASLSVTRASDKWIVLQPSSLSSALPHLFISAHKAVAGTHHRQSPLCCLSDEAEVAEFTKRSYGRMDVTGSEGRSHISLHNIHRHTNPTCVRMGQECIPTEWISCKISAQLWNSAKKKQKNCMQLDAEHIY